MLGRTESGTRFIKKSNWGKFNFQFDWKKNRSLEYGKVVIRAYQSLDCEEVVNLFYNTVHKVNVKDYTKEQVDVWATEQADLRKWNQSLQEHDSVVAVTNEMIVGFGDIDKTGYLDRLFPERTHPD